MSQMLSGLDLYNVYADPARHLIAAAVGSTVDYLHDLYDLFHLGDLDYLHDLDRYLSKVRPSYNPREKTTFIWNIA